MSIINLITLSLLVSQIAATVPEWKALDGDFSRPSVEDVAGCANNMMPTYTLGGCSWIKNGTMCAASGMFWYTEGHNNVYAMCSWDDSDDGTCSVDATSPCAVIFDHYVAPAPAPAATTLLAADRLLVDDVNALLGRLEEEVEVGEFVVPNTDALEEEVKDIQQVLTDVEAADDEGVTNVEAADDEGVTNVEAAVPVLARRNALKSEKAQSHINALKYLHIAGTQLEAAGNVLAAHMIPKEHEAPAEVLLRTDENAGNATEEDEFLAELALRHGAADEAANNDFRESLMSAVDTSAMQEHYQHNNNIAKTNFDNTAVGLANLQTRAAIQERGELMVDTWSQGLDILDEQPLPTDIDEHALEYVKVQA